MQNKPEDRPKIIALGVASLLLFLVAIFRLVPLFTGSPTPPATTGAAGAPAVTPAAASSANPAALANDAGKPGQMRRFDDTMDSDAPVTLGASFAGESSAFRKIEAPVKVAVVPPVIKPVFQPRTGVPIYGGPYIESAPPVIRMVPAPQLEVVLDGVYQAGQERVAQLTILGKSSGVKDSKGNSEQTVYRRVGEYIGRFRILGLTDSGLALSSRRLVWTVGETAKLDEGLIPAPQNQAVSPRPGLLPILSPR